AAGLAIVMSRFASIVTVEPEPVAVTLAPTTTPSPAVFPAAVRLMFPPAGTGAFTFKSPPSVTNATGEGEPLSVTGGLMTTGPGVLPADPTRRLTFFAAPRVIGASTVTPVSAKRASCLLAPTGASPAGNELLSRLPLTRWSWTLPPAPVWA